VVVVSSELRIYFSALSIKERVEFQVTTLIGIMEAVTHFCHDSLQLLIDGERLYSNGTYTTCNFIYKTPAIQLYKVVIVRYNYSSQASS